MRYSIVTALFLGSCVACSGLKLNRRDALKTVGSFSFMLAVPQSAPAVVYLDPDRYGDKELKIGAVAAMKQSLRNALLKTPSLAPGYLELAVLDALSFEAAGGAGGMDGSIALAIAEGAEIKGSESLVPAVKSLKSIQQALKRTKEVTFADLIAFAGAEALEATGAPRCNIQIGRYDNVKPADADSVRTVSGSPVPAFERAGLTSREAALLIAATGEVALAVSDAKASDAADEEEDDEERPEDFVPNSFGAPKEIYGKTISTAFGTRYVDGLKKGKPSGKVFRMWEDSMQSDAELQKWVAKYAGNKGGFTKDVPEAYQKLTLLGTKYTTRKDD